MSLPILNLPPPPPDNAALVRYFHQTERHWTEHLAEASELDIGVAFANPAMPKVRDANRIMMASLPDGISPPRALELADEHYQAQGLRCWSWIMNPSAEISRTLPLIELLLSRGYSEQRE